MHDQCGVPAAAAHACSPSIAAPRDTWASGVRSDYARVWVVLADAYDRAGAPEDAARNRARAAEFLRVQ